MNTDRKFSPQLEARIAGGFYLITFLGGSAALFVHGALGSAVDLFAGLSYVAVAILFYDLFKPVNKTISLVAAFTCTLGFVFGRLGWQPSGVDISFVCFGFYCQLIAFLIIRSAFLPRALAVFMAIAGVGWLTFLSPSLSSRLSPYNLAPGVLGEAALMLWLLAVGLNAARWREQAAGSSSAY